VLTGNGAAYQSLRCECRPATSRLPHDIPGAPRPQETLHVYVGHHRRDEFDAFRKKITWEGHADKIRAPFLCIAGEAEELSPLEHSDRLMAALKAEADGRLQSRGIRRQCARPNLGPFPPVLLAIGSLIGSRESFLSASAVRHRPGEITKTAY